MSNCVSVPTSEGGGKMKVLITEVMWSEGIQQLEENGMEVYYDQDMWRERSTLLNMIKDYDAIIVRNQTIVDEELLDAGINLKAIGRLGVGLDNINVAKAKEKGISIILPRNANATSVAEFVFSTILHANRPIHLANEDVKKGYWDRQKHTGNELFRKTIGLIGLGEISHRVAKRAHAFGMKVVGFDPFITEEDHIVAETSVDRKELLEDLLEQSDFISIHVPLTPSTKHLISVHQLNLMKPNAYLINTSRGGIIDESALYNALREGAIAGAYLDVLETEPIDPSNKLLTLENAILTPHIAGLTRESQMRITSIVVREIIGQLKGDKSMSVL